MSVEVIGLYGLIAGGVQDGVAQIDIPQDGFILGLDWDVMAFLNAATEFFKAELSFIATNQLQTNDVRGRISSISTSMHLLTSGANTNSIQKYVDIKELNVAGGERLFLHFDGSASTGGDVRCNVHFEMRGGSTRRSARRR